MRKFKTIDLYGSIILVFTSIAFAIIISNEYSLLGYFVVGSWQVISMIVHEVKGYFIENNSPRRRYHVFILILISASILGLLITPLLMLVLYFLLFISPFMAIGYAYLCYHEISVKMARPMAQLK